MKTDKIRGNMKIDRHGMARHHYQLFTPWTMSNGHRAEGGVFVVVVVVVVMSFWWWWWLSQVGPNGAHCYHNFSYLCSSLRLSLESPPDYYRHYDNRDDHHADSDRDRHNYADDH